jgi:hypothetical protein
MNRKRFYFLAAIAVVAIIGAIYYYSLSNDPIPASQRFNDIFDEEPSVSCSNLVLTAWSGNKLAVGDDLKIALNDILHARGITAPIPQVQFDDIVSEHNTQFKELFTRAGNKFYVQCEALYLRFFEQCEEQTSNQSDFLKCWVDSSSSDGQQALYQTLTDDLTLPDVEVEPHEAAPISDED